MTVHNFARPVFCETNEIKNSNVKFDINTYIERIFPQGFMVLRFYSHYNNYDSRKMFCRYIMSVQNR